jgi:hypothetical protein
MGRIGAIVTRRRRYELAKERWDGVHGSYGGEWDGQVFVLTHRPADDDDTRISFVSSGLEEAVGAAQESAGDKEVEISAEASLASAWKVGLLDKIVLHSRRSSSAPVFGSFGDEGAEQVELERVSFGVADRLTDLRFRVQS